MERKRGVAKKGALQIYERGDASALREGAVVASRGIHDPHLAKKVCPLHSDTPPVQISKPVRPVLKLRGESTPRGGQQEEGWARWHLLIADKGSPQGGKSGGDKRGTCGSTLQSR